MGFGLFKRIRRRKPEKTEKKPMAEEKPVPSKLRLFAEGALEYPAFVEACKEKKIVGKEAVITCFEQLYRWYSGRFPILGTLEAHIEAEANMRSEAFDEVVFWADVMMVNGMTTKTRAKIPGQYAETYRRITARIREKKQ